MIIDLIAMNKIFQNNTIFFGNNNNYNEDDNPNEEYIFENQNENHNENIISNMNDNNASEYTTPESIASAQNVSQTETSINTQFVRVPTRFVSPRQDTNDPQPYLGTSLRRNITFNFPEEVQDETRNITSIPNTSVIALSPTRTFSRKTRNTTGSIYDLPSNPSAFQQSNKTIQPENIRNNNQQTSSQHYDPINYSFFPPYNTNIQTNNNQYVSQSNNITNVMTQHPYAHLLQKIPHKVIFLHKIKEHPIQTLYNLLK